MPHAFLVALLVAIALAFAWSMGAHYTGACMGMSYASGSIRPRRALALMAVLAFAGALLASHAVELTVGRAITGGGTFGLVGAAVTVGSAFLLTTLYTWRRLPTSTIQMLVLALAGVAVAHGTPVRWSVIAGLAVLWVCAPPVAFGLGFVATRLADRLLSAEGARRALPAATALVVMGAVASFALGANDVSNASGVLVMTGVGSVWTAGLLGGLGLAAGVLTWGRPLLETVAFDVVTVDLRMATGAQFAQALLILGAAVSGSFTSMNQALVGAMAGAGMARGRSTIHWSTVSGILRGWAIGPVSGFVLGFVAMKALGAIGAG